MFKVNNKEHINFEHISHIPLVLPLLTLNKVNAGWDTLRKLRQLHKLPNLLLQL